MLGLHLFLLFYFFLQQNTCTSVLILLFKYFCSSNVTFHVKKSTEKSSVVQVGKKVEIDFPRETHGIRQGPKTQSTWADLGGIRTWATELEDEGRYNLLQFLFTCNKVLITNIEVIDSVASLPGSANELTPWPRVHGTFEDPDDVDLVISTACRQKRVKVSFPRQYLGFEDCWNDKITSMLRIWSRTDVSQLFKLKHCFHFRTVISTFTILDDDISPNRYVMSLNLEVYTYWATKLKIIFNENIIKQ